MAYTESDVLGIPRDTWVLVADTDMRFQIYVQCVNEMWAYEGLSTPSFEPELGTPARLINNRENNEEAYVDWEFKKGTDGKNLYLYSKGSKTSLLLNI